MTRPPPPSNMRSEHLHKLASKAWLLSPRPAHRVSYQYALSAAGDCGRWGRRANALVYLTHA